MASTISTLAPLPANGVYTSPSVNAVGAGGVQIIGTVYADEAGSLAVEQSFDNQNWDATTTFAVVATKGQGFTVALVAPFFRLVYTNGATLQTVFRLYADLQDDNGNFVSPANPSEGGEYVVLVQNSSGGYTYVGRFDGNSGWDACASAAIQSGNSGTYAAFDVSTGVVANEILVRTTEASAASF